MSAGHPGIHGGCSAFSASLETSPIIRALPLGSLKDQKENLRVSNWQPSALQATHHGPLFFSPILYHPLAKPAYPPGPAIKKTDGSSIQSQPAWGDKLCTQDSIGKMQGLLEGQGLGLACRTTHIFLSACPSELQRVNKLEAFSSPWALRQSWGHRAAGWAGARRPPSS